MHANNIMVQEHANKPFLSLTWPLIDTGCANEIPGTQNPFDPAININVAASINLPNTCKPIIAVFKYIHIPIAKNNLLA